MEESKISDDLYFSDEQCESEKNIKIKKNNKENEKENNFCLIMIVRDEAPVIKRCIDSVKEIADSYLICDTGSVDGTPEIIEDYMKELEIPGQVIHKEWVDFGWNRNYLNEKAYLEDMANGAKYLFWLDADEVFVNLETKEYPTSEDKKKLLDLFNEKEEVGVFYLTTHFAGTHYPRYHFVRNNQLYEWKSPVHEYLSPTEPCGKELVDFIYLWARKEGNSSRNKYRYYEDLVKFHKFLEENPNSPRETFYLAQTYQEICWFDRAILWFEKRIDISHKNCEERYIALLRLGRLYRVYKKDDEKALKYYIEAYKSLPYRIEAPYDLLCMFRDQKKFIEGYRILRYFKFPKEISKFSLFCETNVWNWEFLWVAGLVACEVEHYEEALKCYVCLKNMNKYPPHLKSRIENNLNYVRKKLLEPEFNLPF